MHIQHWSLVACPRGKANGTKRATDQKDRKRKTEKRKEGRKVFFFLFFVFATSIDLNARSHCADADCEGVSEGVSSRKERRKRDQTTEKKRNQQGCGLVEVF